MDRRRLECFVALAEELHFNRAANRSGISQPGLSQQLRQLEEQLQVRLVNRSRRHVALTEAGQVFLGEARKILASMTAAVDLTRQTEVGLLGTLKVGSTASALYITMPEIALRFAEAAPQVHLQVQPLTTSEQVPALRAGDIHVGVLHAPLDERDIACEALAEFPFQVVLSSQNPLSERPRLRLEDLSGETFILFPRDVGAPLYDQIIALCHSAGFSPRRIIEVAPAQSIVAMAAANFGVGFVASQLQRYDRPHAVFHPLEGPTPRLVIAVAHPRTGLRPTARQFVAVALEVTKSLR